MGEDKGLMELDGRPMIQHVIDEVKQISNEIIIISNHPVYEQFGCPVYADEIIGKGPLAGLYTGLNKSASQKNIVLSCDVPFITMELIQFLIDHFYDFDITIPEKGGKTHQLIGVFDKSCIDSFKKDLDNNQLKLISAYENLNLNVVNANQFDEKVFSNINTKDDFKV